MVRLKNYSVVFGSGDPRGYTGLAPTFIQFWNLATGTTNAPPSIAETISGKTGVYTFSYGVTQPIAFLLDAATTSPGALGRFVSGQIDPADRADEYAATLLNYSVTLTTLSYSIIVIGSSNSVSNATLLALIGTTASSFGSTSSNPSTIFGFLKRAQEMAEGDQTYVKGSGALQFYNRGSTTLLVQKTIADTSSTTTKN